MFRKKNILLAVLNIFFICSCASVETDKLTIEKTFSDLIKSDDYSTKITAIVMIGSFKETALIDNLLDYLKMTRGVEKTAVLYSLSIHKEEYLEAFINSVATDEKSIKELLEIESSRGSYFMDPYLRIISYLGVLAMHNDKALSKLKAIDHYADGWQGDSIMELMLAAEKLRIKKD